MQGLFTSEVANAPSPTGVPRRDIPTPPWGFRHTGGPDDATTLRAASGWTGSRGAVPAYGSFVPGPAILNRQREARYLVDPALSGSTVAGDLGAALDRMAAPNSGVVPAWRDLRVRDLISGRPDIAKLASWVWIRDDVAKDAIRAIHQAAYAASWQPDVTETPYRETHGSWYVVQWYRGAQELSPGQAAMQRAVEGRIQALGRRDEIFGADVRIQAGEFSYQGDVLGALALAIMGTLAAIFGRPGR